MRRQSGFSMIELLVAMTVTLIVSGAIYGLLTSGSAAFRREPEMADRQQSIRVAMDLVTRDVFNAGAALSRFSQMFTVNDPTGPCNVQLNGCGPEGSMGAAAAAARAPGDGGDPFTRSDVLEIVTTEETCPHRTVCSRTNEGLPFPGQAGHFIVRETIPACIAQPGLVMLTDGLDDFLVQMALGGGVPNGGCPGTGTDPGDPAVNGDLNLSAALPPWVGTATLTTAVPAAGAPPNNTPVVFLYAARIVRYRIAPNNDPLDPGPALWRSRSGRYGLDGLIKAEPGDPGFPDVNSPWELVARGIEDFQVEYLWGDGQWHNSPMPATAGNWVSVPRRVRVTMSARASAANIQGATVAQGVGPDAIRGQLVTEVTPRAAFNELQMGSQIQ